MKKIKKRRYLSFSYELHIKIPLIFIFVMSLIGIVQTGISQNSQNPYNCEVDMTDQITLPHPDCEIARPFRCVRVKFHDINNTNGADDYLSDAHWRDLLEGVNDYYKIGNIRWVFDGNCVHREKIPNLVTTIFIASKLYDINGNWDPQPEMAADEDAVNVYFVQDGGTKPNVTSSVRNGHSVITMVSRDDIEILSHELGHALSLKHTFGFSNLRGNEPLDFDEWEYKTRGVNKNCDQAKMGDELCDTGADPFGMDLDIPQDSEADRDKYVDPDACIQKPELQLLPDARGDITETPWDVPILNIMSYYGTCRQEFTPCQYAVCMII